MKKLKSILLAFCVLFSVSQISAQRYTKNLIAVDSTLQGNGTIKAPLGVDTTFVSTIAQLVGPKQYVAYLCTNTGTQGDIVEFRDDFGIDPLTEWILGSGSAQLQLESLDCPGKENVLAFFICDDAMKNPGMSTAGFGCGDLFLVTRDIGTTNSSPSCGWIHIYVY